MKFSICNEMFEGWDFARVCKAVRDAGYSGLEVAPFTLGKLANEVSASERAAMREVADGEGIEIVGLHWLLAQTSGFHINSADKATRDRTAAYLIDLANLCADLGGQIMVFGSPKQRSICDNLTHDQVWRYAVETFRTIAPALEARNIFLCLEPLSPAETDFINTADDAARMIREVDSPSIQLLLDVKAMSSETKPMPQIICDNQLILKHFHANDANMRGPGFGNTDFVPIAAALKAITYEGWVSVEVFDYNPDPVTIATNSMEYLRRVFM